MTSIRNAGGFKQILSSPDLLTDFDTLLRLRFYADSPDTTSYTDNMSSAACIPAENGHALKFVHR
jgi:hypothetical protein